NIKILKNNFLNNNNWGGKRSGPTMNIKAAIQSHSLFKATPSSQPFHLSNLCCPLLLYFFISLLFSYLVFYYYYFYYYLFLLFNFHMFFFHYFYFILYTVY